MAKRARITRDQPTPAQGDNGVHAVPLDRRVSAIARAIGRLIAREQANAAKLESDS
jgi:hypothetical protein